MMDVEEAAGHAPLIGSCIIDGLAVIEGIDISCDVSWRASELFSRAENGLLDCSSALLGDCPGKRG